MSVKTSCEQEENRSCWKGASVAMLEIRLNSKDESKREEKKRKRRGVE